jgi:hypothetical protein
VSNLRERVKGDDRAAIEAAMKQLNDASMELGKVVYESTKDQPAGAQPQGKKGDDVIDAEYEVKDGN